MKDTSKAIYESTIMEIGIENRNRTIYDNIPTLESSVANIIKYTPERVAMVKNPEDGAIYCEFENNLERFMKDNNYSFQEAMDQLSETYNIHQCDINIILNEMDITKLDFDSIKDDYSLYKI